MAKNIAKKLTRPVDSYLKFVQQSFNVNNDDFSKIARELNKLSRQLNKPGKTKINKQQALEARDLYIRLGKYTIINDPNKYNKFDKLGVMGLDSLGVQEVYRVSDEIINDIYNARDWLADYKRFADKNKSINNSEEPDNNKDKPGKPVRKPENKNIPPDLIKSLHDELILLGKSILGRATELCPMKTGTLRRSGVIFDMGSYIRIAFTAPYATYVHENMDIVHPVHKGNPDCGGQAKFLETALQEFFPDKTIWTETTGQGDVAVQIGINPLWLNYIHYSG